MWHNNRSVLVIVTCYLLAGAASSLSDDRQNSNPSISEPNAAELVRAVRASEKWIHEVDSIFLRIEQQWTDSPEVIAEKRANLKKQFPDREPNSIQLSELKLSRSPGILVFAIERNRLRFMNYDPDYWQQLIIWDGKQAMVHEKYFNHKQESHNLDNTPRQFFRNMTNQLNWLRSQPHSFWWRPLDVEGFLDIYGRPEEFQVVGRDNYRGYDCYLLECKIDVSSGVSTLTWRWYVGVKDRLLYGLIQLRDGEPRVEHWTLNYQQVAPDCWLPMTQGHQFYRWDEQKNSYLPSAKRDLKVKVVRINEKLPDDLFRIVIPTASK